MAHVGSARGRIPTVRRVTRVGQASARTGALRHGLDVRTVQSIHRDLSSYSPTGFAGLEVGTEYRTAHKVGGDFFDMAPGPDRHCVAIIGDVAGKGLAAALIMSQVLAAFRSLAARYASPSTLLQELNEAVLGMSSDHAFVTAAVLAFSPDRRMVHFANAGHVIPLVRYCDGTTAAMEGASGLPLGVLDGQRYPSRVLRLQAGDAIVMMTDGVTEAVGLDMAHVRSVVSGAGAAAACIVQQVAQMTDACDRPPHDDMAVVAIRIEPGRCTDDCVRATGAVGRCV